MNLSEFVKEPFTLDAYFDFEDFTKAVHIAIREMDRILDEGLPLHPLKEQREAVKDWRQIGLGILGLGDMFIKMGIRYGSDESIEMAHKIGALMARESLIESAKLAKRFGMFPKCSPSAIMKSEFYKNISDGMLDFYVGQYGLRHSQLLTIAPTGSISTMLGTSGGIEPLFATEFYRTTKSLHGEDTTYKVYADIVEECHQAQEWEEMPDYIVTSRNLDYKDRIRMQSTWQKYIDAAISSTINLPQETTKEEVYEIYLEAWKNNLKGCTIYRSGCEREGILVVDGNNDMPEVKNKNVEEVEAGTIPALALDSDGHTCPLCGGTLEATEGCFVCPDCGMYSKCEL